MGDALPTDEQLVALIKRVHRACLTVSTFERAGPRGYFSTWPAYRLDFWDFEQLGETRTDAAVTLRLVAPPRFAPTAREIDDALPALALLDGAGVTKQQRKIIRLRALQAWYGEHVAPDDEEFAHWRGGWRRIGQLTNCSHKTARKLHFSAMRYALIRQLNPDSMAARGVPKSSR